MFYYIVSQILYANFLLNSFLNKGRLESIRNELESIKNKIGSSQIIHIESLDISKSFEETKKVFDKVMNKFKLLNQVLLLDFNYFLKQRLKTSPVQSTS